MDNQQILFDLIQKRGPSSPDDQYVLFVGAGASLSAGASLFSTLIETIGAPDYEKFSEVFDGLSDTERHTLLMPHIKIQRPSQGALQLAQLIRDNYFSVILTTNFDCLIELAFHEIGLKVDDYDLIINDPVNPIRDLNRLLSFGSPRVKVVKLHGDFSKRRYAITRQETLAFNSCLEAELRRLLATKDILILGSQFADLDLLRILDLRGGSIWYINPKRPIGHIAAIMEARGCARNVIDGEAGAYDTFISDLYSHVITRYQPLTLDWTILIPFSTGLHHKEVHLRLGLQNPDMVLEDRFETDFIIEGQDAKLVCFEHGVAVWVLKETISCGSIAEFANHRRRMYRSLLKDRSHPVVAATTKIMTAVDDTLSRDDSLCKLGYALSLVNITNTVWPSYLLDNAIKLLCTPSLVNDYVLDGVDDERATIADIENSYLSRGIERSDIECFSCKNVIRGYASWSGVSVYIENNAKSVKFQDIVDYDVELQSYWWYLHLCELSCQDATTDLVREQYAASGISKRLSRLLSIGPTEHANTRAYKEAIIRSSRIQEKWLILQKLIMER